MLRYNSSCWLHLMNMKSLKVLKYYDDQTRPVHLRPFLYVYMSCSPVSRGNLPFLPENSG